ncbi:MAG TPA: YkgJ family cysteine cluster protein [Chitinophagaceae bacterium]|nr:YkgJ family cysteine cluster protein [Chitinophagaceae bacterium]
MRRFLARLEKNPPKKLDQLTPKVEREVWKEIDCVTCANCCKSMTPTYTMKDMKRISAHFGMTMQEFKDKWLYKEHGTGDWLNRSTPCQFLDQGTNMCTIYDIRPTDCAGFPHFSRKKMVEYMHVHKQNVEFCPATYRMVEKMMEKFKSANTLNNRVQ